MKLSRWADQVRSGLYTVGQEHEGLGRAVDQIVRLYERGGGEDWDDAWVAYSTAMGFLKGAVQALEELGLPAGSWHELPTWRQVADEHYSEVEV